VKDSKAFKVGTRFLGEASANDKFRSVTKRLCKKCRRKAAKFVVKKVFNRSVDSFWCDDCASIASELEGEIGKIDLSEVVKDVEK